MVKFDFKGDIYDNRYSLKMTLSERCLLLRTSLVLGFAERFCCLDANSKVDQKKKKVELKEERKRKSDLFF